VLAAPGAELVTDKEGKPTDQPKTASDDAKTEMQRVVHFSALKELVMATLGTKAEERIFFHADCRDVSRAVLMRLAIQRIQVGWDKRKAASLRRSSSSQCPAMKRSMRAA